MGDALDRVRELDGGGETDRALDLLFDTVDDLLLAGRFGECDAILRSADAGEWSATLLVGLLTVTLPARGRLAERAPFVERTRAELAGRGRDTKALLSGLE